MAGGNHRPDTGKQRLVSSPVTPFHFYISTALFSSLMVCFSLSVHPVCRLPILSQQQLVLSKVDHAMEANSLVNTKQRTEEKVPSLQERKTDHVLIAGLRPKGFSCVSVSQAARLGNNVSALYLIYLLISQTTCFFYCIYFKHSFKLCIILQSF